MFNELYRVLVKLQGNKNFQGTGRAEDGAITIENNIIHQMFYKKEDAMKLRNSLNKANIEAKIIQGS